jgi:hypothetical protein
MTRLGDPVLVGGLSYSGKTQLRLVLGAHPALSMTRRTYMWERFYGRFGDLRDPLNCERCLTAMCADAGVRQLEPDRGRVARDFEHLPRTYANLFALFHSHHAERLGARRWGDQLGFIELYADLIFESLPGARMVHMVRDPRERLCGAMRRSYPGWVGWETARWLRSVELARRNETRHAGRYLVLRYEELAADTRASALRVCDLIGESCAPEMEEAMDAVVFEEPGRRGEDALRFVDHHAAGELAGLGYGDASAARPRERTRALEWARAPVDRVGMTAWRVLKDRPLSKRVGS